MEAHSTLIIALLVLSGCYLLAGQEVSTSVRQAIRRHLQFIGSEEWPAMARQEANLQHSMAVGL